MVTLRMLLTFLVLTLAAPLAASDLPAPFKARYDVSANGFKIGEMLRELSRRDATYVFETTLYTTGMAKLLHPYRYTERSTWENSGSRVRPLLYKVEHSSKGVREQDTFDWQVRTIDSRYKGRHQQVPLAPEVMDKQLYQFALRHDLSRGAREMHYQVADRGRIRDYRFEVLAEETLDTPLGQLKTFKIARGETVFWCAPALDYMVVKLTKEEDGNLITGAITALEHH